MWKWICLVLVTRVTARLNESCTISLPIRGTFAGLRCDNGQCVDEWYVCDGESNCEDHSDEQDCSFSDGQKDKSRRCSAPWFGWGVTCPSGECIQRRLMCDGKKDCMDGADEKCRRHNSFPVAAAVNGRQCVMIGGIGFSCGSTSRCIPEHWFCDGERDCPGGEDEEFCAGPSCRSLIGPGIRCGNRCVPKIYFCDGDKDCFDGRDEANCLNSSRLTSYTEYEAEEVTTSTYTLPSTTTTTRTPRPSKSTISTSKLDSEFSNRGHLLQPASEIHYDSKSSKSSLTHIFVFLIPFLLILQTSQIFNHYSHSLMEVLLCAK